MVSKGAPGSQGRPRIDREHVHVSSRAELRAWLVAHHETSPGIWLVTYKASSGYPSPSYDDIVEEALCFGWIDSTVNTHDAERSKLLLTPRKPTSTWSASNKRRLERLVPAGLMAPAGVAAVEVAKQNGSWSLLDSVERLEVPDDLVAALAAVPTAKLAFDGFSPSSKKNILWWVKSAKRPETRARRIAATVAEAAEGRRANYPEDRRKP